MLFPLPFPGTLPVSICLILGSSAAGGLLPDTPLFPFLPGVRREHCSLGIRLGFWSQHHQTCWVIGKLVSSLGANFLIYGEGFRMLGEAMGN